MAILNCPKCQSRSFDADEDPSDPHVMRWLCYACNYTAVETEVEPENCPHCAYRGALLTLQDGEGRKHWCQRCGHFGKA